jgi:hypothetical protein
MERSVAIVGSRAATAYGNGIAADLVEQGVTVVYGGAFGIDVAAHRGARAVGGPTVRQCCHLPVVGAGRPRALRLAGPLACGYRAGATQRGKRPASAQRTAEKLVQEMAKREAERLREKAGE